MTVTTLGLLGACLLAIVGGTVWAFVLALKSKRLTTLGYVAFAATLLCGIGTVPALGLGWTAVQRGAFDFVAQGGDPMAARGPQTQYKIAAGLVIAGAVVALFFR